MKSDRQENGYLVVEASLALFFFTFFILFIWSFAGVFSAQNLVSHAAFQTVQSISVDNYARDKLTNANEDISKTLQYADNILKWFNGNQSVIGSSVIMPIQEHSNKEKVVSDCFYYIVGGSIEEGKNTLKTHGIQPDTLVFEIDETALSNGVLRIKILYEVDLKFNLFGNDTLSLEKCAECRLFGSV